MTLDKSKVLDLLKTEDSVEIRELFVQADMVRRENVGDQVHLRGLIEISNKCRRKCKYCGISAEIDIPRYDMKIDEIMECAENIVREGFGTIVLQAGEGSHDKNYIYEIISAIKSKYDIAVTLSFGEHSEQTYKLWKSAGADRYLLRFETSDRELYKKIHPNNSFSHRIEMLRIIKNAGFETGTGVMIGLPGQTYESIVNDLFIIKENDIDMIGIGPYIPDPSTPLGKEFLEEKSNLVPNTMQMTLKVLALARIINPDANIPSTTALNVVDGEGLTSGLQCGCNVIMPNFTPEKYRKLYTIYPDKKSKFFFKPGENSNESIRKKIDAYFESIGRIAGIGKGNRGEFIKKI